MSDATKLPKVTRVTVVTDEGRVLERWNLKDVELHLQDEGRTLKIFTRTAGGGT